MTQASLDALRDIHLPPPPGWWPPAPGWWLLAALLAAGAALWWWLRHRRRAPMRAALHELAALAAAYDRDGDPCALAAGVSRVLRRYVLWRYPAAGAAALNGTQWLEFLDRHGAAGAFGGGPGALLATLPYQAPEQARALDPDVAGLLAVARRWLQTNAP